MAGRLKVVTHEDQVAFERELPNYAMQGWNLRAFSFKNGGAVHSDTVVAVYEAIFDDAYYKP